jgi:phosphate transport system protein
MVLKELLSFWHDNTPLAEILKRFDEMIAVSKEMFAKATSPLKGDADGEKLHHQLIQMDSKINTLQQVIRRDIVTHISVQGMMDIVPCFLLISLTKDVERIGDYCKNFLEIYQRAPQLAEDPLLPDVIDMRDKILIWFEQTKRAFDRSDRDLAKTTREEAYLHEKECDRIIWALSEDNKGRNAVAIAMIIRFFKRIAAHLGNVCTSVVMPFDKLDYFEKPGKPGELIEDDG